MAGTEQYLIDTNILIYFFDGQLTQKQKNGVAEIFNRSFIISVISKIEFLGFKEYLDEQKYQKAKEFVGFAHILPLSDNLIERIIEIRQHNNLKLGDAVIAATAIENNLVLLTRNEKDFDKVQNLKVINPFSAFA